MCQQRDAQELLFLGEGDRVVEQPAAVALAAVIGVHHQILEDYDKSALRRADGEKQVDHADDAQVIAQDENPPAARLFEDQLKTAHLLGLVRMKIRFVGEEIGQQVGQQGQIFQRGRLDTKIGHARFVAGFRPSAQGSAAQVRPNFRSKSRQENWSMTGLPSGSQ